VTGELEPTPWLVENVPPCQQGRALDVATGLGHNAVWLATQGWEVTGIDISEIGLGHARHLAELRQMRVNWVQADLTSITDLEGEYELIVVTNYLQRERLPEQIMRALAPGGILLFETFTIDQLSMPGSHVRNPNYMLHPNELLRMFSSLRVRRYRDTVVNGGAVASLAAEKEPSMGRKQHTLNS
jgi:2-polyprenyl-3-methyl-5-hydroxy-6-metoxy-1,4-benzoquinol methylase